MENKSLKKIVTAALLAAMTCIATMIIKVPTPTMGYIHLGDGFVLLCGVILGPVTGFLFHRLQHAIKSDKSRYAAIVIGGIIGEAIMVIGYFLYEAGIAAFGSGGFTSAALAAGIVSSATGIPFNIVQGIAGIIISVLLLPILMKISDIREWTTK